MRERGMSWYDLRKMIDENKTSNAIISYFYDPDIDKTSISIFDRNMPRRKPGIVAQTGASQADHWRDSLICRAAFFNGEIPIENNKNIDSEFHKGIYRGALTVLEMLLSEGCLRRTDDLRHFFTRHGRRFPAAA